MKTFRSDQFETMLAFSIRSMLFQSLFTKEDEIEATETLVVDMIQAFSLGLLTSKLNPQSIDDGTDYENLLLQLSSLIIDMLSVVEGKLMDASDMDRFKALQILSTQDNSNEFTGFFAGYVHEKATGMADKLNRFIKPMDN